MRFLRTSEHHRKGHFKNDVSCMFHATPDEGVAFDKVRPLKNVMVSWPTRHISTKDSRSTKPFEPKDLCVGILNEQT